LFKFACGAYVVLGSDDTAARFACTRTPAVLFKRRLLGRSLLMVSNGDTNVPVVCWVGLCETCIDHRDTDSHRRCNGSTRTAGESSPMLTTLLPCVDWRSERDALFPAVAVVVPRGDAAVPLLATDGDECSGCGGA
jgi:hypothetical protein